HPAFRGWRSAQPLVRACAAQAENEGTAPATTHVDRHSASRCQAVNWTSFVSAQFLQTVAMSRPRHRVLSTPLTPCRKFLLSQQARNLYFFSWLFSMSYL